MGEYLLLRVEASGLPGLWLFGHSTESATSARGTGESAIRNAEKKFPGKNSTKELTDGKVKVEFYEQDILTLNSPW